LAWLVFHSGIIERQGETPVIAARIVVALALFGAIPIHTKGSSDSPADSTHALYGATEFGGRYDWGVVYKVDQAGNETVLYSFTGGADGAAPNGDLVCDSAGNLYGTSFEGGKHGRGNVFKVDPSGNETVLHNFAGPDGGSPEAGVVLDAGGNLYGTTNGGGADDDGVVFKIDPIGNETVLYSFTGGSDGGRPNARLIRDSLGNLYGTTASGGAHNSGVVYKVDPVGNETVLYAFTGGADGGYPSTPVTRDSAGNLYGTTDSGGTHAFGVVYKVDSSGNETVLHSFTNGADGRYPYAGVVRDAAGNLYGSTHNGGHGKLGVVYKLDASGNLTVLHSFTGGADGAGPGGRLVRDSAGNLYGTTYPGGANRKGVVYKIDLAGQEQVLHTFTGADGWIPFGVILR
jgi:uncharacterized repeat protein (TIGR03803 family)